MKPATDRLIKDKVRRGADVIRRGIYTRAGDLKMRFALTDEPVAFADRLKLEYAQISEGEKWGRKVWDCAWFHIEGDLPDCENPHLAIDLEGEGCVYTPLGVPVRGITDVKGGADHSHGFPGKRYVPLGECVAAGAKKIDLWVDAANNDLFGGVHGGTVKECAVVSCNAQRRELYYDYAFLMNLSESTPDANPLHYAIVYALEQVSVRVSSDMTAERIAECKKILEPHLKRKNIADPLLEFYAVGHSHLDLAWLWPLRETRRKAIRTFSTALANLEIYPEYVYGASQPQQFEWVKADCPALYAKLKEAVKGGRFELQGGMWVEADNNVTGGESLVRQFLYGKRFWREEFGKDTDILWLPDVFGFSGALPQIMRGCGCENFLTIKLSWNMVNEFPHHSFRWRGIDGSEVLVHMPPEGNYNGSATPKSVLYAAGNYAQRGLSKNAMLLYGIGDGGGGPGREHIEFVSREKNVCGVPNVKCAPASEFFAKLKKEKDKLPVFCGEMYLERHQGTYTSQSANKRNNRKTENALCVYEFAQAATGRRNKELTDELWKETLLYQFHDIVPGSSIKRVYDESVERYAVMRKTLDSAISDTFAEKGSVPCVCNASSFERDEYVEYGGEWYRVKAAPYSVTALAKPEKTFSVYSSGGKFGNSLIEAQIDESGKIVSVINKTTGRQALAAPSGEFKVYTDVGDAWDFYHGYRDGGEEKFAVTAFEPFIEGAKAGVRVKYAYNKSTLVQTVSVTENSPFVRVDVFADWRETEKMLRTDFYPAVNTNEVTCDIQWGSVKRKTTENNSVEAAQYEVCAHKWVDSSSHNYGVALLSDCKYGFRCKDGCVSAHLLRSQMGPCDNQDKGEHEFSYAIYPHEGGVYNSPVAAMGYAFNRPLAAVNALPRPSLVSTNNPHAVIETVKPAEDGSGTVVRLYNDTPEEITAKITASGKLVKTDMLERGGEKMSGNITLRGFEILTFKIQS